jgi:hypothetical protein
MTKRLDPELVSKLVDYNPITGILTWKVRDLSSSKSLNSWSAWNSKFAGKEAICCVSEGYKVGAITKVKVKAHRVAWCIHHGYWPKGQIDHINGNGLDNRIENLRDVNNSENQRNSRIRSVNTSGHMGVHYEKRSGKWMAYIGNEGELLTIGYYSNKDDAIKARVDMEVFLGYHDNHGRL